MKRLALIVCAAPGAALAHGGHAPVPDMAHGLAHAGPTLATLIVAVALVAGWRLLRRSE